MLMSLMLRKLKMTFFKNWTVFKKHDFTLTELRNRIKYNNKEHILYRNGIKYQFKSVKNFCKKHKLDETTTYHVLNGKRQSTKGFTL